MESPYLPIENYGVIGNMRTAALVGINGSIDWLCLPRFDSSSVFAAILDDRVGQIEDYMPIGGAGRGADRVVRRVHVVRGSLSFHLECRPAFDYARTPHQTHIDAHGARFDGPGTSLGLATSMPLQRIGDGVAADFTLNEGEKTTFVLTHLT